MQDAYDFWKNKQSPLWLLMTSRSEAGDRSFIQLVEYLDQFSNDRIEPFDSPTFMEGIQRRQKDFLKILKQEAVHYHAVFHNQYGSDYDAYTQEILRQVEKIYGKEKIGELRNHEVTHDMVGNMAVAIAMNAIADMALVEYLHRRGDLKDQERQSGLNEINQRLDWIGLNGVDKLFESKPELERFIESDTTIIPIRGENDYTRAAYYNRKKRDISEKKLSGVFMHPLTELRQIIIGKDFSKLEEEKNHYIQVHVHNIPEPTPETRKKYAKLGASKEPVDFAAKSLVMALISENDKDEYFKFLLHDGLAINHPQRDTYAASLRQHMQQAAKGTSPSAKVIGSRSKDHNPPLLEDKWGKNAPLGDKDSTSSSSDISPEQGAKHKSPEKSKGDDKTNESAGAGAKIATIGGAAAVGLLLATGRDKDKTEDNEKQKTNKGKALRFAALASAAAVSVGGAIMWSKKPEFLYKPMRDFFNSLGFGRA